MKKNKKDKNVPGLAGVVLALGEKVQTAHAHTILTILEGLGVRFGLVVFGGHHELLHERNRGDGGRLVLDVRADGARVLEHACVIHPSEHAVVLNE